MFRMTNHVAITRFEQARLELFLLECEHRLICRLGYLGEDAWRTKDTSHHGGFDLNLTCINLHGPGESQRVWQSHIKKIHWAAGPWTWGRIDYVDPGNAFYEMMMHVILADCPANKFKLVREDIAEASIRNLNACHTGDIFEAILASYFFTLDPEHLNLSPQEQERRAYWLPRVLAFGTAQMFADYAMVLHEMHSLLFYFKDELEVDDDQVQEIIDAIVNPLVDPKVGLW